MTDSFVKFSIKGATSNFVLVAIATLLIVGIASPYEYNVLPIPRIFDALLLLLALTSLTSLKFTKIELITIVLLMTYFLYYFLMSTQIGAAHPLDVFQSSKFIIYIVIFIMISRAHFFTNKQIQLILFISIAAFFIKYLYSITLDLTDSMSRRPGVLTENNFELIYLAGIFFFTKDSLSKKVHGACLFAITIIMLMGGSRSAIASFFIASTIIYTKGNPVRVLAFLIPGSIILLSVFYIFDSRGGFDINSIDRFRFYNLFILEMEDRSPLNWIFGDTYLTPMSSNTCRMLSFYEKLFSFNGDSTCYSVILHSFLFRVIIDHGILFYSVILFIVFSVLNRASNDKYLSLGIVALVAISGLSVSSFNSSVAAFMIAVIVGSSHRSRLT